MFNSNRSLLCGFAQATGMSPVLLVIIFIMVIGVTDSGLFSHVPDFVCH